MATTTLAVANSSGESLADDRMAEYSMHFAYPSSMHIGLYSIGFALGLAILAGNIFFVVTLKLMSRQQQKLFKNKTAVILASMGFCETYAGLALVLHVVLYPIYDKMAAVHAVCYYWMALQTAPILGSTLHLTLLGAERFIAVCYPANYPNMKRSTLFLMVLWIYTLFVVAIAIAFDASPSPGLCDILKLAEAYVIFVAVHLLLCLCINTYFILKVRNTVKLHQRKIQVSNTITYNNLVEDAQSAILFYASFHVHLLLWVPFLVSEMVRFSDHGAGSRATSLAVWWCYLLGNFAYLKFLCFLGLSRTFRNAMLKSLHKKKTPCHMGTLARDG